MSVGTEAAAERVAARFTRPMRAATSRFGVLATPQVAYALFAVIALVSVVLYNLVIIDRTHLSFVYVAMALPAAMVVGVNFGLRSARSDVIAWLGALPFVVDNVNALFNGIAVRLVVRFEGETPTRAQLTESLQAVHEECFALEFHETVPEVELMIGVADGLGASFARYRRARAMIDDVLVTVHSNDPIASVRVS